MGVRQEGVTEGHGDTAGHSGGVARRDRGQDLLAIQVPTLG